MNGTMFSGPGYGPDEPDEFSMDDDAMVALGPEDELDEYGYSGDFESDVYVSVQDPGALF